MRTSFHHQSEAQPPNGPLTGPAPIPHLSARLDGKNSLCAVETRRKCPLTAGFSNASFESPGLRRKQTADFGPQSLRQKIPFLAPEKVWCREFAPRSCRCWKRAASEVEKYEDWNQGWARPSRSNCSDHSAGASRKLAMPMPRGSRPSTAALTRAGAMNAIDIVMLT